MNRINCCWLLFAMVLKIWITLGVKNLDLTYWFSLPISACFLRHRQQLPCSELKLKEKCKQIHSLCQFRSIPWVI